MANVVDIVASIIIALIVLAVSFYLFTMYCHPEEKGFGNELFPKVLVIISQAIAWGQLLLLPLDLSFSQTDPSSNFYLAYYVIYPIIFFLVVFLNPVALYFYQSDPSDSFGSRLCWSIVFSSIVTAIWSAFVFISYVWLGVYTNSQGDQVRLQVPMYIFLAMSLIGWILLAFNGGIGLVYLPYDLIRFFVFRPKRLSPEQGFNKKQAIQEKSGELITYGQKLKQQQRQMQNFEGGWFRRKRNQAKFNNLLEDYKKNVNRLQDEYQLFQSELKIHTTHPVAYIASLIGGIIAIVVSIFWVIQILGTMIEKGGKPIFLFIDQWLYNLNNSSASFVATIIYGLLVLYMQVCLVKGNTVFGIRIPFIVKLHPMLVNKTYMNSLLFNSNLMLLASLSTSLLAIWAFPTYFSQSYLSRTSYQAFNHEPLFSAIYGKKVPMILMEVIVLLTILTIVGRLVWRKCRGKDLNDKPQK